MDEWFDLECPECGGADIDLVADAVAPLFECQECGERFDAPTDPDKPPCPLVGTDGNVFAVIGNVSRCLKRAGKRDRAKEWVTDATASRTYDEVLQKAFSYVDPM